MQITPPYGYTEVVPFLKNQKARLLAPGETPKFAQNANAIPISMTEFQPVARHYPIVFAGGQNEQGFAPVAVLGLASSENLFCDQGKWAHDAYIPAYARRFPFCMAKVNVNRVEQKDRLICIEKSYIDESGEALFVDKTPTEKWKTLEKLLGEYENDLERSREMCAILSDYGLLEPFSMQATPKDDPGAKPLQMAGMFRVAEKNLENLNTAQLKNLMRKGILARVYIHLLSLENFGRLLDRRAARRSAA